jgi:bla regulator protein BlaR1
VGLLSALSADEVEAIIVHELAHIKRRDYLVNLLQSLIEIVFFFNPAVLWISQLIKTERENCCDDLALEQSSNKISYIRALVSCEEYQQALPAYAMAFAGSKNSLLDRVKRLASNRNHSLNIYEKTALAVCLVVSGLCMSAFAERETIKRTVHEVVKSFEHSTINKIEQQKLVEQTNLLKQQTVQLNHALPSLIDSSAQSVLDTNKRNLVKPVPPVPPVNAMATPAVPSIPVSVHVKPTPAIAPKPAMPPMNVTIKPMVAMAPMNVSIGKLNGSLGKLNGSVNVTDQVTDSIVNVTVHANVNVKSHTDVHPKVTTSINGDIKTETPDIGDELLKAQLIKDKTNFSIKLTNDEFIVNGVKQSEETHQRFLKKYQKKPGDKVNMTISVNQKSTGVFKNPNLFTTFLPQNC